MTSRILTVGSTQRYAAERDAGKGASSGSTPSRRMARWPPSVAMGANGNFVIARGSRVARTGISRWGLRSRYAADGTPRDRVRRQHLHDGAEWTPRWRWTRDGDFVVAWRGTKTAAVTASMLSVTRPTVTAQEASSGSTPFTTGFQKAPSVADGSEAATSLSCWEWARRTGDSLATGVRPAAYSANGTAQGASSGSTPSRLEARGRVGGDGRGR